MRRAAVLVLAAAILAAAGTAGCSRARPLNQLRFGIWAVEHDLWNEAVYRFKRELEADPRSAAAHNNLAVAYEHLGLWDEARKAYEAALALAPGNASIKENFHNFEENLAGMYGREGEPGEKKPPAGKKGAGGARTGPRRPEARAEGHAKT